MFKREYAKQFTNSEALQNEFSYSQFCPYQAQISNQTIGLADGSMMQTIRLEGIYLNKSNVRELNDANEALKTMMMTIADPRISIWHNIIKTRITIPVTGNYANSYAKEFVEDYQEQLNQRKFFKVEHYITVVMGGSNNRVLGFMELINSVAHKTVGASDNLRKHRLSILTDVVDKITGLLSDYNPHTLTVIKKDEYLISEPLSFIFRLINGFELDVPLTDDVISTFITATRPFYYKSYGLLTHHSEPEKYFSSLSIKNRTGSKTKSTDIDHLLKVDSEFVFTQTFEFEGSADVLETIKTQERKLLAGSQDSNEDLNDVKKAKGMVASGKNTYGKSTIDIILFARSKKELHEGLREADNAFRKANLIAVRDDVILEAKHMCMFPSNLRYRTRVKRVSSENFADFSSMHVDHSRPNSDENIWGSSLLAANTINKTPYYFDLHNDEVGNTVVTGFTGSGKTVFMVALALFANKYDSKVIYLDKGRAANIAILALGGSYQVIKEGVATGFNPCLLTDTPKNRAYLINLFSEMLKDENGKLTIIDEKIIENIVKENYQLPNEMRRMRNLMGFFPRGDNESLGLRFSKWINDGRYAWIFDNENDEVNFTSRYIGFDLTDILKNKNLRAVALSYIAHRIDESLDGTPTMIFIDEGWQALDDTYFSNLIKEWELTIRKREGLIVFGTQSPIHLIVDKNTSEGRAKACAAIIDQSPTKIYGYNPEATKEQYVDAFDISDHQYFLISNLKKRQWLVTRNDSIEIIELDFSGMDEHLITISGYEKTIKILDEQLLKNNNIFDRKEFISMCKQSGFIK